MPQPPEPTDYYVDEAGRVVFTEAWHLKRGYCCGNGCRHCPYGHSEVARAAKDRGFFEAVYEIVRLVPRGRVTTFGAVAEAAGMRISARTVGWALSMCSGAVPPVPAHRVVNRLGVLTGRRHFATPFLMQELLEQEGVKVEHDTVIDFKKLYWDPRQDRP